MTSSWVFVGLGAVLTLGTAVFVAAEFSLVALDPSRVDESTRHGRRVAKAHRRLATQLWGAQVGITVSTILLGYTAQPALTRILRVPLEDSSLSRAAVGTIAAAASLVVINLYSMLFGELVPKNLALSEPARIARLTSPFTLGFSSFLRPLIRVLNGIAGAILRAIGIEPKEELAGGRSPQELAALVRRSAEAGTLAPSTALLLKNSLDFAALTALDVMTDRTRMAVLDIDATAADVVATARSTGHSRFPVMDGSHDDIVGLVHLRAAVGVPEERRATTAVRGLMMDAPRIPETVTAGALLEELRRHGHQMAIVVDEYGGTAGLVTLEDVVEELVGEVADEHDRRRVDVHRTADGGWSVPGLLRPDEVLEVTGLVIPDDAAYETVGGYVMARLGRLASVGDEVSDADVRVRVEMRRRPSRRPRPDLVRRARGRIVTGVVLLTVALLAANAFFVGAEFAVISARRSSIEPRAEEGSRSARIVLWAMENVSLMLACAQLGITVCSVSLGIVAEPALAHLIEPATSALGLPDAAAHGVAAAIGLLVVVGFPRHPRRDGAQERRRLQPRQGRAHPWPAARRHRARREARHRRPSTGPRTSWCAPSGSSRGTRSRAPSPPTRSTTSWSGRARRGRSTTRRAC